MAVGAGVDVPLAEVHEPPVGGAEARIAVVVPEGAGVTDLDPIGDLADALEVAGVQDDRHGVSPCGGSPRGGRRRGHRPVVAEPEDPGEEQALGVGVLDGDMPTAGVTADHLGDATVLGQEPVDVGRGVDVGATLGREGITGVGTRLGGGQGGRIGCVHHGASLEEQTAHIDREHEHAHDGDQGQHGDHDDRARLLVRAGPCRAPTWDQTGSHRNVPSICGFKVNEGSKGMSIEKICWIPAGKLAGSIDTVTDWSTAVASPGRGTRRRA